MGKYSDADIDAMLKRIHDNVEKQSTNYENDSEDKNTEHTVKLDVQSNTPEELINLIMADIGKNGGKPQKSTDIEQYDISGFEIEETVGEELEEFSKMVDQTMDEYDETEDESLHVINEEKQPLDIEERLSDLFVEITQSNESENLSLNIDEEEIQNTEKSEDVFVEEESPEMVSEISESVSEIDGGFEDTDTNHIAPPVITDEQNELQEISLQMEECTGDISEKTDNYNYSNIDFSAMSNVTASFVKKGLSTFAINKEAEKQFHNAKDENNELD